MYRKQKEEKASIFQEGKTEIFMPMFIINMSLGLYL